MQALQASLKPESKVLQLLRKEVTVLTEERHRVEAHLARAHAWAQHLGKWRATVHNAEVFFFFVCHVECLCEIVLIFLVLQFDIDSQIPQFVLVVHMDESCGDGEASEKEGISTGWVLLRTLAHFQVFHCLS